MYELREGTLALATALNDPDLADRHALEVIGHAMIGADVVDPGATALIMAKAAAIAHTAKVGDLTNTQRALLSFATHVARRALTVSRCPSLGTAPGN